MTTTEFHHGPPGDCKSPASSCGEVMAVPLSALRRGADTQSRVNLDGEHVERLREALENGARLEPPIAFFDGEAYWLADGFHRAAAHEARGAIDLDVEVRQGTRRDAILHSVGANATHGLPRSNADKRRAVETLLRDEEWSRWSDREIARRAVVDHKTVAAMRERLTGEVPQCSERMGADGRVQNTAGIAEANRARGGHLAPPVERTVEYVVLDDDEDDPEDAAEIAQGREYPPEKPDWSNDREPMPVTDPEDVAEAALAIAAVKQGLTDMREAVAQCPLDRVKNQRLRDAYEAALAAVFNFAWANRPPSVQAPQERRAGFRVVEGGGQ